MLGNKQFELSNHLGNVLTTVSDRKLPHTSDNITIDYYTSDITSAQDYYPFGQLMPGRNWSSNEYKFGFNGKLNDDEVFGATGSFQDYGMRMYDTRTCRFWGVDPITKKFPYLTPYQFASNRPIDGIDLDGLEYYTYKIKFVDGKMVEKKITHDYTNISASLMNSIHGTEDFYKIYSKGFGNLGRGILYNYEYTDTKTGKTFTEQKFFNKESYYIWDWGNHGIYYGPGCPTKYGPIIADNQNSNSYDYSLPPVDEVDALARQHDKAYDFPGYSNWKDDVNTIDADKNFIKGLERYIKRANYSNYKDIYTNRRPSEEALDAATNAYMFFKYYVIPHKEELKKEQEKEK